MSSDSNLSYKESKKLAKKLRRDDPQQFQTLVRMHLSFVLDLTTDDTDVLSEKTKCRPLKWGIVPFSKKGKGPERENVESYNLTPDIVKQINSLVEYLSLEENICQEGIFRRSGKVSRQQELKGILHQGVCPKLSDSKYSVHDVASVLKSFLAELPEPLLTDVYYPAYCQISELCRNEKASKARVLRALQLLFLLLPFENRRVLKTILGLLHLTASHVSTNKMSAQNLATLFTPHLLCPRKLSPEIFHTTAQSLSCIVVFVINQFKEVFEIPPALATDIKAYWDRMRRTPDHLLERSISESTAAKTVFTFVDRERTAQENVVNPTETALAQLYAHIQGLPESNKKKRLIKQFNKENGQGTPRTKSIGVSIKKHIFCKNAKAKGYFDFNQMKNGGSSSEEFLNSSPEKKTPMRYKTVKFDDPKGLKNIKGVKRLQTDVESESEESPPKVAREEGGNDNSQEQETSSCTIWFQSLSVREKRMVGKGALVAGSETKRGRELRGRERGIPNLPLQGLPVLEVSPNDEPRGSELLEPAGRFRPVVLRRGAAVNRLTPLLPRRRIPSVIDSTFWDPPVRI